MKKQYKPIPEFANEKEERQFWEQNDSTDYLDWNKAWKMVTPNLSRTCMASRSLIGTTSNSRNQ